MGIEKNVTDRLMLESYIANDFLTHPAYLPAMNKITDRVIQLLETNYNWLSKNFQLSEKITEELYSEYHFGIIAGPINHCISNADLFDNIIKVLREGNDDLALTMHIHQIFQMNIFPSLPIKSLAHFSAGNLSTASTLSQRMTNQLINNPNDSEATIHFVRSKLFMNGLFHEKTRVITNYQPPLYDFVGIAPASESQALPKTKYIHRRAVEMMTKSPSNWTNTVEQLNLPFVAGPSGHAGSLLMLASLIGDFSTEESKEYIGAITGLLAGGGYHSFNEVIVMANQLDLSCPLDTYDDCLPSSYKSSDHYLQLQTKYHQFLHSPVCLGMIGNQTHYLALNGSCDVPKDGIAEHANASSGLVIVEDEISSPSRIDNISVQEIALTGVGLIATGIAIGTYCGFFTNKSAEKISTEVRFDKYNYYAKLHAKLESQLGTQDEIDAAFSQLEPKALLKLASIALPEDLTSCKLTDAYLKIDAANLYNQKGVTLPRQLKDAILDLAKLAESYININKPNLNKTAKFN